MWYETLIPNTMEEAVFALSEKNGQAVVIAGGTDLVPQYKKDQIDASCIVDVTRIPGMRQIELDGDRLVLGGAVTHALAAESSIVRNSAVALSQACLSVGSPQIRNVGTIAGNIVNAQPAADAVIALVALDATVNIVSDAGRKSLPILELYEGVGKSKVDHRAEIVESITFNRLLQSNGETSEFIRLSPRQALALPIVNLAVALGISEGRFTWIRVGVGPVSSVPFRPYNLEGQLADAPATDSVITEFSEEIGRIVSPRDSAIRGSSVYRKAMVAVLARRAIQTACARLQGS